MSSRATAKLLGATSSWRKPVGFTGEMLDNMICGSLVEFLGLCG